MGLWCFRLKFTDYKKYFEWASLSKIYEYIFDKDDRINIERILNGEKKKIENALKQVTKTINQFMEIKTDYMNGDNNTEENSTYL